MADPAPEIATGEPTSRQRLMLSSFSESLLKRRQRIIFSYQATLEGQTRNRLARLPWATWFLALLTGGAWCATAAQVAFNAGLRTWPEVLTSVLDERQDSRVLLAAGAKYTPALRAGEYWRLITPIFLHANLWLLSLSLLTLLFLGWFVENIFGHTRFILIYLLSGMSGVLVSIIGSPREIGVGASGALLGLAGAYGAFLLIHRLALRFYGLIELGWLALILALNLGLGLMLTYTDTWAHIGGLLGGCLLGGLFSPFYRQELATHSEAGVVRVRDIHSMKRRWPMALLALTLLLLSAIIALSIVGG